MQIIFLSLFLLLFVSTNQAETISPDASKTVTNSASSKSAFFLQKIFIKEFRFTGNQSISDEALLEICKPYQNTQMTFEQLQALSQKLTYYLINQGYSNSGVIIPDQQIDNAIVTLQIIEGMVSRVDINGNRNLSTDYIRQNIDAFVQKPVNIYTLRQGLQLLQQNPRINKVNARLKPDLNGGESILDLNVEEKKLYKLWLELSNDYSPSIGSNGAKLNILHNSLFGNGDRFYANIATTEDSGLLQYEANYSYPIIIPHTSLSFYLEKNDTTVVEAPFKDLDIESNSDTFGISLTHTLKHTPEQKFNWGLSTEVRSSNSQLLGEDYNYEDGTNNSATKITVLRLFQDWTKRSQNQVMAIHSSFNIGLDAFNATLKKVGADGRYLSWTGQFQYLQRLGQSDNQVLFKAYAQLSRDALLAMERISLGGISTVRGYRENELVGDNGYAVSLAMRIPVFHYLEQQGNITLEPFLDYGKVWDSDRENKNSESIAGVGLGLIWKIYKGVDFSLYGAKALKKREHGEKSLQDEGIHFNLTLTY